MPVSEALLKTFDLLKPLDKALLDQLSNECSLKSFNRRQIVLESNKPSEYVFLLFEGRLQGVDFTIDGREVGLYFVEPGDFFGELNLFDNRIQNEHVVALTSSKVLTIPKNLFSPMMMSSEKFMEAVFQRMANRIRTLNEQRNLLSITNIPQRVSSLIWSMLPTDEKNADSPNLNNPPTHQEIAMMLNLSRETVTRVFKLLQEKGLTKKEGSTRLIVINKTTLKRIIDGEDEF